MDIGKFKIVICVLGAILNLHPNCSGLDMDMRVVGSYRTEALTADAITVSNILFLSTSGGMEMLDISRPADPRLVGNIGPLTTCMGVNGNYLYGAADGLVVFDISRPTDPVLTNRIELPNRQAANDVVIANGRAYVATYDSLHIYDLGDPIRPVLLGSFSADTVSGVTISGSIAYLAAGSVGLQIVDISDPAGPKSIATLKTGAATGRVGVLGHYAYVSDIDGVNVIDITNPALPVLKTKLRGFPGVLRIQATDSAIYIMNQDAIVILAKGDDQPGLA